MAGAGFHTAVDHHQVAVVDPVLAHAIAAGPHVEGANRVGNQGGLEIQALTQRARAEGHRLANRQVGQNQTSSGSSTAVLLLVGGLGWAGSTAGFWPGRKLHIPDLVPGFASGIGQPVKGFAVWSVLGDDKDRCTGPADPPKLLITCQHNRIASGGVLEVWGHRCTVETHRRLAAKPQPPPARAEQGHPQVDCSMDRPLAGSVFDVAGKALSAPHGATPAWR